jgi:hypothetical protein
LSYQNSVTAERYKRALKAFTVFSHDSNRPSLALGLGARGFADNDLVGDRGALPYVANARFRAALDACVAVIFFNN